MSAVDQTVAELGLTLPEIITGHIAGESVAVDPHATRHAIHFPGTGEQITSLQEDDAEAVDRAISTARDSFASGSWSDAGTATRQESFVKQRASFAKTPKNWPYWNASVRGCPPPIWPHARCQGRRQSGFFR